jgi:hypothetical protein
LRSLHEGVFRVRQELANLALLAAPPRLSGFPVQSTPLAPLPNPAVVAGHLRGSPFAAEVERLANLILSHQFPLLGLEIDTGPDIAWRRDYLHGVTSGTSYFRFIPYLDRNRVGDHKIIWELNRHQHLVLLAQAYVFTGGLEYVREIDRQITGWCRANPFLRGINWTSALEVAFRVLSWLWVYHLLGDAMDPELRKRLANELYRHGCYLEHNLSIYFSPNTHVLGEAVALHALGTLFPSLPHSARWVQTGSATVAVAIDRQVRADGSHFEQASYYHVYALDSLLFHRAIGGTVPTTVLGRMADYLAALMGPSRVLPFLGDDDGGRVFHPYGRRDRFGRATLATCARLLDRHDLPYDPEDLHEQGLWWVRDEGHSSGGRAHHVTSHLFPDAGVAVMGAGDLQLVVDAGRFGAGSAGHSHSDTLNVIARLREEEILIDPGTYTYVADPHLRDRFRGSSAHNTIRVDARDQATPDGPFRWIDVPDVRVEQWSAAAARTRLTATCRYLDIAHRRTVVFVGPGLLLVADEVEGPPGEHLIEQFWHFGEDAVQLSERCIQVGKHVRMGFSRNNVELGKGGEYGWRSKVFGKMVPASVACIRLQTRLPLSLGTMFDFSKTGRVIEIDDSSFGAILNQALG